MSAEVAAAALAPPREGRPDSLTPDLDVRVRYREGPAAGGRSLAFEVTARDPALGLQEEAFGPVPLAAEPRSFFERFYDRVAFPAEDLPERVAALGAELARELLPADLHRLLWRLRGRVATLWLRTDEAWVPWEALKLQGEEEGRQVSGPFLCEAFAVARWRAGVPFRPRLPVRRLAVVVGDSPELAALEEEKRLLTALAGEGREVEVLPPGRREVLAAMDGARFDAWHLACHGGWHPGDPGGAELLLGGGESIQLRDLEHAAPNFCAGHPLVFLNSCHLGRGERGLVRWGGWAARLVELQAGAVVAAAWPAEDRAALAFARTFYRSFLGGVALAAAVHEARRAARDAEPGGVTWLAFTAFGHPATVCGEVQGDAAAAHGREATAGRGPGPGVVRSRSDSRSGWPESAADRERKAAGRDRKAVPRLAARLRWAGVSLGLSLLAFAALAGIRTATPVRFDLALDRLAFTVAEGEPAALTDAAIPLRSLTLGRFARLELGGLEVSRLGSRGEWGPVEPYEGLALVARDRGAQISVEPLEERNLGLAFGSAGPASAGPITLERLWVEPGSRAAVRAAAREGVFDLGLEVLTPGGLSLTVHAPVALSADFAALAGPGTVPDPGPGGQLFLRASPLDGHPLLEVFPAPGGIALAAVLGPGAAPDPLLGRELAITSLDLLVQDADGVQRSALTGGGRLSYPDHPWVPEVALAAGDFLAVEGLRAFRLGRLSLDPEAGPLRARFEGVAGAVRSGARGRARDHRLSLYQRWAENRLVGLLVGWIAGFQALALGLGEIWRRLLRDGGRGPWTQEQSGSPPRP